MLICNQVPEIGPPIHTTAKGDKNIVATKDTRWLREQFKQFYKAHPPSIPPMFRWREWGFFYFGENIMKRHVGFVTPAQYRGYLSNYAPQHVYYSTAVYDDPAKFPMSAKVEGWKGAELVFDLDADHLPGADDMTFQEQLDEVKVSVRRLIYEYLLADFGFDPKFIKLKFSGGRGYHVHVRDPKVFELESAARMEIVDYITGTGLKIEPDKGQRPQLYDMAYLDSTEYQGRVTATYIRYLHPRDAPGWGGRVRRGMESLIDYLRTMDEAAAVRFLVGLNKESMDKRRFGKRSAENIYHACIAKYGDLLKKTGNISVAFSGNKQQMDFIYLCAAYASVAMSGDVDEPVTKDTRRLIRAPDTLHGKTGFRTVPLTLDQLAEFEPTRDAIAFGDDATCIRLSKDIDITLHGTRITGMDGETLEVPLYAAVFLIGKRMAGLEHAP